MNLRVLINPMMIILVGALTSLGWLIVNPTDTTLWIGSMIIVAGILSFYLMVVFYSYINRCEAHRKRA